MKIIWTTDKLPKDDDWKFVKLSSMVPEYKLSMGPRYSIACWKDGMWSDLSGNEVSDVIGWTPLREDDYMQYR